MKSIILGAIVALLTTVATAQDKGRLTGFLTADCNDVRLVVRLGASMRELDSARVEHFMTRGEPDSIGRVTLVTDDGGIIVACGFNKSMTSVSSVGAFFRYDSKIEAERAARAVNNKLGDHYTKARDGFYVVCDEGKVFVSAGVSNLSDTGSYLALYAVLLPK